MAKTASDGLSQEEREAVKNRAKELRDQAKAGKSREAGTKQVLEAIDKLDGTDREIAEGLHKVVGEVAPDLVPKTYYGFPAYANAAGKVVVAFKNSGKFNLRYSTLEFQDAANLDDGDVWPVSFGIARWSPAVEQKVAEAVVAAVS